VGSKSRLSVLLQGGMCSVYLKDSEKVVSISSEHLEPITPTKNNKVEMGPWEDTGGNDRAAAGPDTGCRLQVKVILGEDREATGVLLSIDGEDGIIRMDLEDQQIKILNLRFLGKLLEA
jgi:transcription elongation factor SPT5